MEIPSPTPRQLGPLDRARAYALRASALGSTLARYALMGRLDGVRNGGRAFRQLAHEIRGALERRPGARACPLCGWSGERFAPVYYVDSYREDVVCYGCGAADRARLLAIYCKSLLGPFFAASRRRVLDIGPLRTSRAYFPEGVDYVSFDLYAEHAMVRGDLCAAPFPDRSFDLWVCFHVLDLIEDDERAMRELYRVLAPGGIGLLDNVMNWQGPTEEYGRARPEEQMHRRRYGVDLLERLTKIGFTVEVVDVEEVLSAEVRARFGILPRKFLLCRRPATTDARAA